MPRRANLEVNLGTKGGRRQHRDGAPLRILVLGAFSGREVGADERLVSHRLSVDNFDAALARLAPRLTLATTGRLSFAQELSFTALEDFHPDSLIKTAPALRNLLELCKRLDAPATHEAALHELAELFGRPQDTTPAAPAPAAAASGEDQEQLLARLLGKPQNTEPRNRAKDQVQSLIREAFGSSAVPAVSEPAKGLQQQAFALLTQTLRAALTFPPYRDLERAWRSVHWLTSRVEEDQAHVYAVDLPKESLRGQLQSYAGRLDASPFYALLNDATSGETWDVIIADYTFFMNEADLMLITTAGAIASRADAPLIAHGDLGLCGCQSPADAEAPWTWAVPDAGLAKLWSEIRAHPAARWIALAAPRFLLRHPYGQQTDPIDSFRFEELPSRPQSEAFLWGNPAFACAYLIASAPAAPVRTWPAASGGQVRDLPAPVYHDGTGQAVQPPIELVLTERARAAVEAAGLIAFAGGAHADYIAAGMIGPVNAS